MIVIRSVKKTYDNIIIVDSITDFEGYGWSNADWMKKLKTKRLLDRYEELAAETK